MFIGLHDIAEPSTSGHGKLNAADASSAGPLRQDSPWYLPCAGTGDGAVDLHSHP